MNQKNTTVEHWDSVIESKHSLFDINLKELWHYRDLLVLFVCIPLQNLYVQTTPVNLCNAKVLSDLYQKENVLIQLRNPIVLL